MIPSHYTKEGEEARYDFCMGLWRQVPVQERIPLLIETLERYRDPNVEIKDAPPDDPIAVIRSGKGLNDLIIAAYRLVSGREAKKLCMVPDEQQALTILRTAHHYCGHGEDTAPPLRFALRHFRNKLYSDEFFDSLRAYRACLRHTKPTTAQGLKSQMDLILWQDLRFNAACWSARIQAGLRSLKASERAQYRLLFQSFCYSAVPTPPSHWAVDDAVSAIGKERCAEVLLQWISEEAGERPILTATGSAVLKNIVWAAESLGCTPLDEALHRVIFLRWKNAQPISKVAIAQAWLWSCRKDRSHARVRIEELNRKFGYEGGQIERIWRESISS